MYTSGMSKRESMAKEFYVTSVLLISAVIFGSIFYIKYQHTSAALHKLETVQSSSLSSCISNARQQSNNLFGQAEQDPLT